MDIYCDGLCCVRGAGRSAKDHRGGGLYRARDTDSFGTSKLTRLADRLQRTRRNYQLTTARRSLYGAASVEHAYVHELMIRFAQDFAGTKVNAEPELITPEEFKNALDLYRAG